MTILKVQGPIKGSTGGTSISLTMSSTPIYGNVLVAVIGTGKVGGPYVTVTSITEDGVSWSKQVQKTYRWNENNSDYEDVEIWLGIISTKASKSIVIQLSSSLGGMGAIAYIAEYSGIDVDDYLDNTATDTGYTPINGNPAQTRTGTTSLTSKADELWIGGIACGCMNSSIQQTNPTNGFSLTTSNVNTESVAYLEKIVSSTGQAYTNTTISYADWVGCIITLKGLTLKIGGIYTVKRKLMEIIVDADSSLIPEDIHVLPNWRIELWKLENDFPIITVRVGIVNLSELIYGRKVGWNQQGHYVSYQFSLHVWHENADEPYPKSKNACDLADEIIDVLEMYSGDSASGIERFYNITSRESEPERGPQQMSRVIIEGFILVKRVLS